MSLDNGYLRVGHAVYIGDVPLTPSVKAELYIREDSDRADETHPRITMEDRNGLPFLLEMDSHSGINKLQFYYPCLASEPGTGLCMSFFEDQSVRFYSDMLIKPGNDELGTNARLGIGTLPTRDLEVNGVAKANAVIFNPVDLTTIANPVDGTVACDINDSNTLKKYDLASTSWVNMIPSGTCYSGSYTGNGSNGRLINIGFQPKYVQILSLATNTSEGEGAGSFFKTAGMSGTRAVTQGFTGAISYYTDGLVQIDPSGFRVWNKTVGGTTYRNPNRNGQSYVYVAFF